MSSQFLEMSDEEFGKLNSPDGTVTENPGETPDTPVDNPPETNENPPADNTGEPNDNPGPDESVTSPDAGADPAAGEGTPAPDAPKNEEPASSGSKEEEPKPGEAKGEAPQDPSGKPGEVKPEPTQEVDYKAFYERLIGKPIRANGKDLVLKTPEEVERMIQMGAGYGRKMQDMQPHLKTLRMLEKAELLDENKLSYLIDIHNKNPDAIRKLIKESGIDPLDINVEGNVDYTPQNHAVSEQEVAFQEALSEIQNRETGNETIQLIHQTWDNTSKEVLWSQPDILEVIQTQRENGIYAQIAAEIDRQKLLGKVPQNMPFLQAYKLVGDTLFQPAPSTVQPQPTAPVQSQSQPQVIATRVEQPKAQVTNSDKARAAGIPQTTSRKATAVVNPLEMADDEFLKTFNGRL